MTTTPLMLTAGQGLTQNKGLSINATLTSNINTYKAIGVVKEFSAALSAAFDAVDNEELEWSTFDTMQTFTASSFPVINDTIPAEYAEKFDPVPEEKEETTEETVNRILIEKGLIEEPEEPEKEEYVQAVAGVARFTDILVEHANNIMGNGDLSKFITHMFSVQGLVEGTSELIKGAQAANTSSAETFSDMDSLTTGGITDVSKATELFGEDLLNTGELIDFSKLSIYGTPGALLLRLHEKGLLKVIEPEFATGGIAVDGLITQADTTYKDGNFPLVVQKKVYEAFKLITGTKLDTIKTAFGLTSDLVETLADLLNTHKIFSSSFRTLTSVTKDGVKAIYLDNNGTVNNVFNNLGKEYYSLMPKDIADANVAFRRSIQQIKGIDSLTAEKLGTTAKELQTNYGLDSINAQTSALPADVHSYYTEDFASGSGKNGQYYLSDGIGTPAGITHNESFESIISDLNKLTTLGALDGLYKAGNDTGAFTVMKDFLNGVYGIPDPGGEDDGMGGTTPPNPAIIPGGYPGAGSYTNYDSGITAIIGAANSTISGISSSYSTEYSNSNTKFTESAQQIKLELDTLAEAGVVFDETPSSKTTTMSLVSNLHSYAKQDNYRGVAEMLEKLADTNLPAGQALVGALREGRNLAKLQASGVGTDNVPTNIEADAPADLSQTQYSAADVTANIKIS